jgi:hypothetical protein
MRRVTVALEFAAWLIIMWFVLFAWDGLIAFLAGLTATVALIAYLLIDGLR